MKMHRLYDVNKILQYTGFIIAVGFPDDKPVEEWVRGDIKIGFVWQGFKGFMD